MIATYTEANGLACVISLGQRLPLSANGVGEVQGDSPDRQPGQ